ncbi:ZIP zinc transporter-domain-containing protein [Lipomyces tetrasporus]|uniref:ZIP zinc transporter-domain-containing protein n=1 Tax=Lipomyces tetrasporus TaxID=54092 RepID=A0AAD7QML3_9ASCO|nr:ZIP zinc transporter-domain-containing protein [Lipomyces tetrasporus]KAJ8098120.1 ZIP zinc transporter-domain-containing protein [Lipomyces tetrasporus]
MQWWEQYDPVDISVNSTEVPDSWKVCVLEGVYFGANDYGGMLGARISSIFVIGFVSTAVTLFPYCAKYVPWLRIPKYVYLFARYFGSGVIIATAFVHLLDSAYSSIGPNTSLVTLFFTFLIDIASAMWVEHKHGIVDHRNRDRVADLLVSRQATAICSNVHEHTYKQSVVELDPGGKNLTGKEVKVQFAAFLVLEFGIIFHSVAIGISLGACGTEFKTLYPLRGPGARLSAIRFKEKDLVPYICGLAYGLVTPISIAIGLGVRTTYNGNSYTSNVVHGVLLARDFIFDQECHRDKKKLLFMVVCTMTGASIMALLGKWA